jgi:type IV pilus assembly protein PilW
MMAAHPVIVVNSALRQRGLSLVELMVALLIGLILTAGVIQIFVGSSQTYRMNEGMSRVQENLRFGMEVLQRDIRMAGFAGCSNNIRNHLDQGGAGYLGSLMSGIAVVGWEYPGTAPGDDYSLGGGAANWVSSSPDPLPVANALPGSDILVISRAERLPIVLSGNPSSNVSNANNQVVSTVGASGVAQGTIVMVVNESCAAGDLWQNTNQANATGLAKGASSNAEPGNENPPAQFIGHPYNPNASVYSWASVAYYIGAGASGEPALFQQRINTGGGVGQTLELVEGVENMQILYGVDDDGNRRVNRYLTAAAVPDWNDVISVRLSLLLRTPAQANSEMDTREYTLLGTVVDPQDDRRIRQVSTTTIGIRNRLD